MAARSRGPRDVRAEGKGADATRRARQSSARSRRRKPGSHAPCAGIWCGAVCMARIGKRRPGGCSPGRAARGGRARSVVLPARERPNRPGERGSSGGRGLGSFATGRATHGRGGGGVGRATGRSTLVCWLNGCRRRWPHSDVANGAKRHATGANRSVLRASLSAVGRSCGPGCQWNGSPFGKLVPCWARRHSELRFNRRKGQGLIAEGSSQKPWPIRCEGYAQRIAMVVPHGTILAGCWDDPSHRLT